MGKGSKQRPRNKKRFDENYNKIFHKSKETIKMTDAEREAKQIVSYYFRIQADSDSKGKGVLRLMIGTAIYQAEQRGRKDELDERNSRYVNIDILATECGNYYRKGLIRAAEIIKKINNYVWLNPCYYVLRNVENKIRKEANIEST